MKKLPEWEGKFHSFLIKNKKKDFKWGEWDCCIFTNAAVKEITGEDLIPRELNWDDEETAKKVIKSYGKTLGKSVQKAAKEKGLKEINPVDIKKGDVAIVKEDGSQVAGICDGHSILCPTDGGFAHKEIKLTQMAFRIDG